MKKLLSILGAMGLVATASAGVVACGTSADSSVEAKDVKINLEKGTATFTKKIKLYKTFGMTKDSDGNWTVEPATGGSKDGENVVYSYVLVKTEKSKIKASDLDVDGKLDFADMTLTASSKDVSDSDVDKDGLLKNDINNVKVTFSVKINDLITDKAVSENWTLLEFTTDGDGEHASIINASSIEFNIPAKAAN